MDVILKKATIDNAKEIHNMQIVSFHKLLLKYEDYSTNPGAEKLDKVIRRLEQSFTHYYIIIQASISVGAVRVILKNEGRRCRISPIFILPDYQGKGIAQEVFKKLEKMYKPKDGWELDTILEEKGNCYLYEKLGYKKTGKIEKVNNKINIVFYEKLA